MKSFASDEASAMTGIRNGVAERLKRVNNVMLNFHCICHRLALSCCDSGNETEHVKLKKLKDFDSNMEIFGIFSKTFEQFH